MEEEQTANQGQNAEETTEETKEDRSEQLKRENPDCGLRRSRRLEQRRPRQDFSDMVLGNSAVSEGENFLASAFSTGSEEAFCMMGIAGEISMGPGEPTSVKEALEGDGSDH